MKEILKLLILLFCLNISCSPSSSSPAAPTPEPPITFTLDVSNASISLDSSFPVVVTLTSALPTAKGINIEVTVTDQTNNTLLSQNTTVTSVLFKNSITIINLPQQHWCLASVKVSSVSTPSNSASQSFTVVYK